MSEGGAHNPLQRLGPGPTPAERRALAARATTDATSAEIAQLSGLPDAGAVERLLQTPMARGYLSKYLDDAGATLAKTALAIAEAHQATEVRVFQHNGEIVQSDPLVDHQTRLKAAELNLKARGELREQQQNVNLFMDLNDEQVAAIAAGRLDPASLIDVGPRIRNPAAPGGPDAPPASAP